MYVLEDFEDDISVCGVNAVTARLSTRSETPISYWELRYDFLAQSALTCVDLHPGVIYTLHIMLCARICAKHIGLHVTGYAALTTKL
jgi:hypothetical protein